MDDSAEAQDKPPAPALLSATAPARPVEVEVEVDSSSNRSLPHAATYSDTNSVQSSARRYEWRHGRRYHGYQSGAYNFPNDDEEQQRLDMVHHAYYLLFDDRLFLAPIDPDVAGLRVLDVGTGTGIWAIHFADEHPEATIVGNDLSPIQPDWVPPNVHFLVDDVELDWADSDQYDFIHCRYMAGSIRDWPRLVAQIYGALSPGGWVEFQESVTVPYSEDGSLTPDNPICELMNHLQTAGEMIGRDMNPAPSIAGWVADAGFRSVREQRFKSPVGNWPRDPRLKESGTLTAINFYEGVPAFTAALFGDVLGWTRNEVIVFNASVRQASRERDVHTIFDCLVITGQKPL